ncbi:MAG: hypothetical protein A3G70_00540 [Planctomycetes bacterium RIFCSPLOWO2_12_FULL_39_13]|nr:MAG: hypothetical protein A3G70_00540 [Planctomycetes bacterium RIFCSPLOWO2_12_FULL_39_13]
METVTGIRSLAEMWSFKRVVFALNGEVSPKVLKGNKSNMKIIANKPFIKKPVFMAYSPYSNI